MALSKLYGDRELVKYDGSQWNLGNTLVRERLELAYENNQQGEVIAILTGILDSATEEFPELMDVEQWVNELNDFLTIAVPLGDALLSLDERSEQQLQDLKRIQDLIRLCDDLEERMYVIHSLQLNNVYSSYQKAQDLNRLITEAGEFMDDLLTCNRHVMALSKDGVYHNFVLNQLANHDQILAHIKTWIQDCIGEDPLHEGIYSLSMNKKTLKMLQTILQAQLQSSSKRKLAQDIDMSAFRDIQAFPFEKKTITKDIWNIRKNMELEGGVEAW